MATASSRFRSVREEDLDSLLVEAVPEKKKVATKYGMKIFHGKNRVEKWLKWIYYSNLVLKSTISIDTFFVNKFKNGSQANRNSLFLFKNSPKKSLTDAYGKKMQANSKFLRCERYAI